VLAPFVSPCESEGACCRPLPSQSNSQTLSASVFKQRAYRYRCDKTENENKIIRCNENCNGYSQCLLGFHSGHPSSLSYKMHNMFSLTTTCIRREAEETRLHAANNQLTPERMPLSRVEIIESSRLSYSSDVRGWMVRTRQPDSASTLRCHPASTAFNIETWSHSITSEPQTPPLQNPLALLLLVALPIVDQL
jgi:hypothetical protein